MGLRQCSIKRFVERLGHSSRIFRLCGGSQLQSLRALAKSDPDADNRLRLVRFQSAPLHRLNIKLQGCTYPEGGSVVQTPVL